MTDEQQKPVVKIGCSVVLSNDEDEAIHGRHMAQAAGLAVDEANADGRLPFHVELVVRDDATDADRAVEVAQEFIADERILGVIGTMNSHTSLATAPYYHRAGLVQIAPAASSIELTRKGYDTFFRLVPHDGWQGTAAARYAVHVLGATRIAILHDRTSFGEPLANVVRQTVEDLDANVVLYRGIDRGQTDFRADVQAIVQAEPDLIYFAVIEAEGRLLAHQLRDAGVRAIYFGTDGLKPSQFLATPSYDVAGPYHTNAGTDIRVASSAQSFAHAYRERYGELYSVYTAEAYDAATLLIRGYERAQPLNRAHVRAAVARTRDFAGATGRISFDSNGDIESPRIGVYRYEDGEMVFLGYTHELLA